MTRQNTNKKASAIRRLGRGCQLLAFAFFLIRTTPLAAQTVAPPNSVFKAGNVYALASSPANVGTGNVAGGYFGNGSGSVFDVAITNSTGADNQLFVLQGNGDGSLSLQPSGVYNFGTTVHDGLNLIIAGPVISPTSVDLVVTDDSGDLYLLQGKGDGTFQTPFSLGQTANTLTSYLNSSGTLNLVISNVTFPTSTTEVSIVTVLVNGGSGNFTPTVVPVPVRSSPNVTSAFALNDGGFTAVLQLYSDGTAGLSQQVNGIFQPPVLLGALGIPSGSAVESQSLSVFTFNGQPYLTGIVNTPTGALTSVASAYVWPFGVVGGGIGISATPSLYSIPTNDAVYVTTADLDGDGIPDLIVLGGGQFSAKQTVNLFLSGSPNGFAPPEIGTVGMPNEILGPGEYGTEVIVADANGDGKNDLLLYEPIQGLTVLLNQGSGVFLTPTTYAAGNTPRSIAKADFNGDGIDDLVVANGVNSSTNTGDNTVSVFVSQAAGGYLSQGPYQTGTDPIAVTTGKVNGNQSVFVLSLTDTTGSLTSPNPVVGFLQGNGDGSLQAPVYFSTGTASSAQPTAIAAGLFDSSGNSTVAVGNSDGTINLFTYQGGVFVKGSTLNATSAAPAYGLSISSLAVADINGDGNLDLVATLRAQCGYNFNTGQMVLTGGAVLIFAGNGAGAFQPPVAVTSSEANYDPASVSLGSLVTASRTDMLVVDAHGYAGGCGGLAIPNPIVFTNGGNLTFAETDLAPQFGGVNNVSQTLLQLTAIADVNGDGANDLIFSQNGLVSTLLNNGTGTFVSTPSIYVGSSSSAGLVTGSFFGVGGHDAALASGSGVALIQAVLTPPRPIITSVTPGSGPTAGGETVIIAGQNFQNGATVTFARAPAIPVTVISATSLSVVVPVIPAGAVDVQVTNPDGQSVVLAGGFLGVAPAPRPIITSVTPGSGPTAGGETVIIAGQNFQNSATVTFARAPAIPVTVISATSLSVVVPVIPAGAVDVQVTNPDGQSVVLTGGFLGVAPPPPPVSVMVSETITVTDAPTFPDVFDAETVHVLDTISVRAYAPLVISPVGPLLPGVVNNPYPSVTFSAVGGAGGPLVLTESGGIPGMGFVTGAGSLTLSGAPTAASSGYTFSITVTDALGDSATQNYVLGVSPACQSIAVSPSGLLAAATVGATYQQQFSQVGAVGNVTWSSSGTLPPGLTLSPGGLLSGPPTTANTYSFAIIATDQNGCSSGATQESLTVNGPVLPPAIVSVTETIKVNDTVSFPDVFDPETIHVNDTVSVITLQAIAVSPVSPMIAEGATQQFTATGTFSDGSMRNLTSAVTWSSSNNGVATMSGNTATAATGHTLGTFGTSTITATLGSTHGSTVLTVNSHLNVTAKLISITLASNGTYVVKLAVTNNGDIAASQVTPAGILGTKLDSSAIPALNIAPGATATVTLVFPATAGRPGTKQNLSVAGLATGTNPNGTPVLPALWALQPTPTQVILP
jgi:hypothetical protein